MESLVNLIIPFIAIIILSSIIDQITKLLEVIMKLIPGLPDQFEWYIGYIIVIAISFFVTHTGNFDLFSYFGFNFEEQVTGQFITALVISGGSTFVSKQFTLIARIPELIASLININPTNNTSVPQKNEEKEDTKLEINEEVARG